MRRNACVVAFAAITLCFAFLLLPGCGEQQEQAQGPPPVSGTSWSYISRGRILQAAPEKVTMDIVVKAARNGRILIGLRAKADGKPLSDIRQNGRSVKAQLNLVDADGKLVKTATGRISDFGFA